MHDRLSVVIDNLIALLHLLNDALGCGVIARRLATEVETAYLTVAQSHGEVGVAVVRHVLLHTELGSTEILLLLGDAVVDAAHLSSEIAIYIVQIHTEAYAWILLISLLVEIELGALLHDERLLPEIIHILGVVAAKLSVDGLVELRQPLAVYVLLVVLQEGSEHFLIERHIPFCRVIFKLMILLLLVLLWTLHLHVGLELDGTGRELDIASSCERFSEIGPGVFHVCALLVELGELVEIHLVGEVVCSFGCILPSTETSLVFTLQVDDADRVDALVHTDSILPVVGALGVLAVILDAHSLVGTHVLLHYFLLDAAYLGTRSIFCVTHHLDAIAGEVSFGTTRITHGHRIVAILVTLERNLSPTLRMIRHIVLAVGSRPIGLRVSIDAEYREVAGLARPHPVVCIATKLTH